MAGLFFCLASTRCRAFILPCCNTAPYKRLQRVLHRQCSYTANAAKQCTELCRGFSGDCARSTVHNTRPTQAAIIPHAPRWSVSQRPPAHTRYHRHAGRCTGQHRPPIIIRYIRVQGVRPLLWIHSRRGSTSQTMPARRGLDTSNARRLAIWHRSAVRTHPLTPSTRRGSPAAGAQRAARNHWRLSPQLFSGFRPIANKGEQ